MTPTVHPTPDELAAFDRGDLPPTAIDRVTAHLETCPACEAALDAMAGRRDTAGDAVSRAAAAPPAGATAGSLVGGRYRLVETVGEGGMGQVWRAEQLEPVRRPVAVKLVKAGMDSAQVLRRFEAERQALAVMDHPHIAKVLDAGATDAGRPYFAMELVDGVPITAYCDARRLTPRERLGLFVPVCRAVQHAHQKGVIHRDLKPSNILVAEVDGKPVPKVIDFGIAKATGAAPAGSTALTAAGLLVGTPEYMAPEQAGPDAADVDTRADVYALGVVLYELLTGSTPLTRERLRRAALLEMLRLVREEEPPTPSSRLSTADRLPSLAADRGTEPRRLARLVRGELDWIALRCLEKDRGRRYDSATALARDVERFLADEVVEARPPGAGYRLRKFVRRHRGRVLAAALVLAAVSAGGAGAVWQAVRATRAEAATARQLGLTTAAEAAARGELATQEAVLRFFNDKLLAAARPEGQAGGLGKDVTLRRAVDAAAGAVADAFAGRPAAEAAVRTALADSYLYLGEPALAVEQAEAARGLAEVAHGPAHRAALAAGRRLAVAYRAAGRTADSVRLAEDGLARCRAALGPDDPDTLLAEKDLGVAYYRAGGRVPDALRLAEGLLPRVRAAFGPDHEETVGLAGFLAVLYRYVNRRPEATRLTAEALASRRRALGPTHPDTLTSLGNLAAMLADDGRPEEALPLAEEAVRLRTAVLRPDHPDTVDSLRNLGVLLLALRRPGEAVSTQEECLRRTAARFGPAAWQTRQEELQLARACLRVGRAGEAVRLAGRVVDARRADPGPAHSATHAAELELVRALAAAGRAAEARPLAAAVLAAGRRLLADKPLGLANELAAVGEAFLDARLFADAVPPLREALGIRSRREPAAWTTARSQYHLGAAVAGAGDRAEAERLLASGYEGLSGADVPAAGRAMLPAVADRLVGLYRGWGRADEAARWRAERAKFPPELAPQPRRVQ